MKPDSRVANTSHPDSTQAEHSTITPHAFDLISINEPRTVVSEISGAAPALDASKQKRNHRRYQLHLWISEKEYTMLRELAELHDEPMSRIVRRLFTQLKHLSDRKAS